MRLSEVLLILGLSKVLLILGLSEVLLILRLSEVLLGLRLLLLSLLFVLFLYDLVLQLFFSVDPLLDLLKETESFALVTATRLCWGCGLRLSLRLLLRSWLLSERILWLLRE